MTTAFLPMAFLALLGSERAAAASQPDFYFGGTDNEAYLEWADSVDYQGSVFLPSTSNPSEGLAFHWSIDEDAGVIEIGVSSRATGWLGFGISENGGMSGSDILIFEAANPGTVKDMYVTDVYQPEMDECKDWEFVDSSTGTDFISVQVRRKLDTGDTQDWAIHNDANLGVAIQRVIAAWGNSPTFGYHGAKHARSAVRLYGFGEDETASFDAVMKKQSESTFKIEVNNYTLPPLETHYADFCLTYTDFIEQGVDMENSVTLIGYKPIIATNYVHHYVVYGSYEENNNSTCSLFSDDLIYTDLIYVWTPGEPPQILPENVGVTIGGETGYKSLLIDVHYTRDEVESLATDNSGLEFYYRSQPREHELGILQLGDPFIVLNGTAVGEGLSEHVFQCKSDCSSVYLDEPVTVLREMLHMHDSGYSMFSHQIRNGEVIRTSRAEYFDFDQQGSQLALQSPYQVQPGDAFKTDCWFKNGKESTDRKFGFGSYDEMCVSFVYYYPKKVLGGFPWTCGVGMFEDCNPTYERRAENAQDADRTFGTPSSTCVAKTGIEVSSASRGVQAVPAAARLWIVGFFALAFV